MIYLQAAIRQTAKPFPSDVLTFLAIVFPLSWALWIPVMLDKQNAVFLNLSGGPALAAMWLASSREGRWISPARLAAFAAFLPFLWLLLISNVALGATPSAPLRFDPAFLLPAAISAWIISGAFSRNTGERKLLRGLAAPPDWSGPVAATLVLPAVLTFSAVAGRFLKLPMANPVAGLPLHQIAVIVAIRFAHALAFAGIFEEPGWRGFLLPRLLSRYSPLMAAVLVWIPWAIWHLPLDLSRPERWSWGMIFQQRVAGLLLTSILLTWFYNQSRRGLLSAVVFHGAMNSFPFILPSCPPLLIPLVLILVLMAVISSRMWRRPYVQTDWDELPGLRSPLMQGG